MSRVALYSIEIASYLAMTREGIVEHGLATLVSKWRIDAYPSLPLF